MKSNRIEVNQSSMSIVVTRFNVSLFQLVSLKAELVRKQAEVHRAKSEAKAHFIHPLPHLKKETVFNKKNKGVEGREERDAEEIKEDEDMHKKS
ncbi:unnamed protein product, partial [Timema podura]|nr:unnamed protein product [Timema podura]